MLKIEMGWKPIATVFLAALVALGGLAVSYASQGATVYSTNTTATQTVPYYFTWAVSNDDGATSNTGGYSPIDPGDNGHDPLQPQSPGMTVSRWSGDVAATSALMQPAAITISVSNAYPGYYPTVFFGLKNASAYPARIDSITINSPAQLGIAVPGITVGQTIGRNVEIVGAVEIEVKDTALPNHTYTANIRISMSQSVGAAADLAITKSASPNPVAPGGTLTYTLTITNNGPDHAREVLVTDLYPAGFSFRSAQPDPESGNNIWTYHNIPPGGHRTITVVGTVTAAGGSLTNTATVTSETIDPNPSNNTASVTTTVKKGNEDSDDNGNNGNNGNS